MWCARIVLVLQGSKPGTRSDLISFSCLKMRRFLIENKEREFEAPPFLLYNTEQILNSRNNLVWTCSDFKALSFCIAQYYTSYIHFFQADFGKMAHFRIFLKLHLCCFLTKFVHFWQVLAIFYHFTHFFRRKLNFGYF